MKTSLVAVLGVAALFLAPCRTTAASAEDIRTRDGFTVRFDTCEKCPCRMKISADALTATVNLARIGNMSRDAMAERAFALMAAAADAKTPGKGKRPTTGWSSWNTFRVNISEDLILETARAMATNGLKAAGYRYVNIDDGFFAGHDAAGRLRLNTERFPNGLKRVADGIHALGLKAGIYSDAGRDTCGSIWDADKLGEGSGLLGHDEQDCRFYFDENGFDFIKVDYCGGKKLHLDERTRYTEISRAIRATGRDIRFNVCRWAYPGTWVADVADSWRTTADINPSWASVRKIVEENLYLGGFVSYGHYNDLDMLEVGQLKGRAKVFKHKAEGLTADEETAHFGLWCILSSPLLIGCDVRTIDPATLALVTNPFLLAMNQNDLGLAAQVAVREGKAYVLAKDAVTRFGTARYVALYNAGDSEHTFKVDFAALDLGGRVAAFDLVRREDLGVEEGFFETTVAPHAARFYRLDAETRLERRLYEAESARLSAYHELGGSPFARAEACEEASGGVQVTHLGGSALNDLVWDEVKVDRGGPVTLAFDCSGVSRVFFVQVDDRDLEKVDVPTVQGDTATATFKTQLSAGVHRVRLCNRSGRMPDIDCMRLLR